MAPEGVKDPALEKLARYKWSKTGKKGSNAARDLQRFIYRENKALPVKQSAITLMIKRKIKTTFGKRRFRQCSIPHTVIFLRDWMECILERHPEFFLGGSTRLKLVLGQRWTCLDCFGVLTKIFNQTTLYLIEPKLNGGGQYQSFCMEMRAVA